MGEQDKRAGRTKHMFEQVIEAHSQRVLAEIPAERAGKAADRTA
jgi:hypothetical protein